MKRVAIGGWQHETNTFAPFETDFRAFEMPDAWPALVEGAPLFEAIAAETLVVLWPGDNPADPTLCRYTKLRPNFRLVPAGLRRDMAGDRAGAVIGRARRLPE
jgi:microcystin degradation protein MlrC